MRTIFFRSLAGALAIFLLGLAFFYLPPLKASAQDPIDMELDASGFTPWNVSDIRPGDSGSKSIILHNAGSKSGIVYIWISDIVAGEGLNPDSETGDTGYPGELGNYLLFSISNNQLTTNITFPTTIDAFPSYAPGEPFIQMPLAAGETVTATWQWQFPETGTPQNDAQGDSLSFNINYWLTEPLPPPSSSYVGGEYTGSEINTHQVELYAFGQKISAEIASDGTILNDIVITDGEGVFKLELEHGTRLTTAGNIPVIRLEAKEFPDPRPPPPGQVIVSQAYEIIGYTANGRAPYIWFSPPARLTLTFQPDLVPENADSLSIFLYNVYIDWQKLETIADSQNPASLTARLNHASIFAVLAQLLPESENLPQKPPPTTPTSTPATEGPTQLPTSLPRTAGTLEPPYQPSPLPIAQAGPGEEVVQWLWPWLGLGVAGSGTVVMSAIGFILRKRRRGS